MKYFFTVSLALMCTCTLFGQGVLIGDTAQAPDPSAILELRSNQGGFLLPRLTTTERNAIVSPVVGLQIYNTTTQCVETFFQIGWKKTACECDFPPAQPTITGPGYFCQGQQNVNYSASLVPGATGYLWTVSPGITIVSGQGTNSIQVNYGNNAGTIQVVATNSCGMSSPTIKNVSPSIPVASFSPLMASIGIPVSFNPLPNYASYSWTFASGSPATSGLQNPGVTWSNLGSFQVSLIVSDSIGCLDTINQSVTVSSCIASSSVTFSSCGATGPSGPSQNQCNIAYGNGVVTSLAGIQQWIVPQNICPNTNALIEVWGAQGGHANGGAGAYIRGNFIINPGDDIRILVGQRGLTGGGCGDASGGGGGGTFVVKYIGGNPQPLIAAGGGAGGNSSFTGVGGDATLTVSGAGGTGGSCGNGPAAAGYSGDGTASCGGLAFLNGGTGGTNTGNNGGFGGGAGAVNECGSSADLASGGGYQGGNGTGGGSACFGGLSFNSGTNQFGQSGVRLGEGQVIISW